MQSGLILVAGAAGQLGVELVKEFTLRGYEVHGLTRAQLDTSDAAAVAACVRGLSPNLVINASAYNLVDHAEHDPSAALNGNALAVRHLAAACREHQAKLVHFSTDYVFDGTSARPYGETDVPNPLGAYGISKLAGEHFARTSCPGALVIRTAAVYGPAGVNTSRGNFVETMLRVAGQGRPLRVVNDQVTSPTYTVALAARTADLVERGASGLVHGGGGTPVSWYDFARLIFAAAGLNPSLTPVPASEYPTPARRPAYSALANGRMEELGVAPMPALPDALADYMIRTARR
jgi:dTDP-4-dehydrorhamnose reductase